MSRPPEAQPSEGACPAPEGEESDFFPGGVVAGELPDSGVFSGMSTTPICKTEAKRGQGVCAEVEPAAPHSSPFGFPAGDADSIDASLGGGYAGVWQGKRDAVATDSPAWCGREWVYNGRWCMPIAGSSAVSAVGEAPSGVPETLTCASGTVAPAVVSSALKEEAPTMGKVAPSMRTPLPAVEDFLSSSAAASCRGPICGACESVLGPCGNVPAASATAATSESSRAGAEGVWSARESVSVVREAFLSPVADVGAATAAARRGRWGEQVAADFLCRRGFSIRDRNWRTGRYELDLVAERDGELHFVEVKTRRADSLTPPEWAMTPAKCRAFRKAAEAYMVRCGGAYEPRFDVVAVEAASDGEACVRFIPDASEAHW